MTRILFVDTITCYLHQSQDNQFLLARSESFIERAVNRSQTIYKIEPNAFKPICCLFYYNWFQVHGLGSKILKILMFRYTKMQQDSVTKVRKYRAILQGLKTPELNEAEHQLVGTRSLEVDIFLGYLENRSTNFNILNQHYALLETDGSNEPLHRKFKLHAAINKMKRDQDLVASLVRAFEENTAIIMGNWSAPNARFHEPVRGVGFRTLLKKNGFPVSLVDEYG